MRRKIFATYIIIVSICLAITGFLTVNAVEHYFEKSIESKLLTNSKIVQRLVGYEMSTAERRSNLEKLVKDLSRDLGARVTLIDLAGNVIADSAKPAQELENHSSRPEVQSAYRGEIGKSVRYSTSVKMRMMYIAVPVKNDDTITGVVRVSLPLSEIGLLSRHIWGIVISAAFLSFLVIFFLGIGFSQDITKPLVDIAIATREIAKGNYDMKINVHDHSEIQVLADSFNYMAQNLSRTVSELKDGKRKLEAILTSMVDSLIAVDRHCHVIMVNPAAEKLFNITREKSVNRHLLEIVRNQDLYDFVNEVLTNKQVAFKELRILTPEEKIFRVHIAPISENNNSGAVAVLRDITDLRKFEKMRTDFVANVSHELKTPLTSIAGFVETLLDGAYKDPTMGLHFLNIIKQETERLERLINDLLDLSRIENSKVTLPKTRVDIGDIANETVRVLQAAIRQKQHDVKLKIPEDLPPVFANSDALIQIMMNLVDNAIKYTPSGGKITISAEERSDSVAVTVTDNGIGIQSDQIPRLFERFYRVDKARSRELGGTGLGLAIVKHLVRAMNGEITVCSELGKGSSFTFTIPKAKT